MPEKTALVLGASGLIGKACVSALAEAGFSVTGVSRTRPKSVVCNWVQADLTRLDPKDFHDLLADTEVVVNAAGALQDGAEDSLEAIHVGMIQNLVTTLEGRATRVVQISAAGVSEDADTAFFETKARGDAHLMQHHKSWVVLRPALVIGAEAYGGTALLRAYAGFPGVEWRLFDGVTIQTVALTDLANAVVLAATGQIAEGTLADLAEEEARSFLDVSRQIRDWQGFSGKRLPLSLSRWVLRLTGRAADGLGWLGWRSPLRSTALSVMQSGIAADRHSWRLAGGPPMMALEETLSKLPAHSQERWFARMYLLLPLSIAVLALFWIASGVIGVLQFTQAADILTSRGMGFELASLLVLGGAVVDVALGMLILIRRRARLAALGMLAVSIVYLLGSAILAPALWLDPLGPMVKVLPGMIAALIPVLFLEDR
ncbi:SDR family oxidoreductase [uncultured Shimia sp.]|uniref:SDR family oxidoreductase n=1 Tax=uncultured Shimia sp. TaxID=573152 RepID=UPI00262D419E|nr:SDR family oxidoreductase [uncultured Shimia sp.]